MTDDAGVASRLGWKQSYAVGVATIDRQHERLIDLIHSLQLSIGSGEEREATADVLDAMERYTTAHFGYEEQLMVQASYAQLDAHRQQHRFFVDSLGRLRAQLAEGGADVLEQTASFLGRWFIEHVLEEDAAYAPALRAAGLTDEPSRDR